MPTPNSLKIVIESFEDEAGYVARIDNEKFKGIVVQSDSLKGALEELFISLKVKIACDLGIQIGGIEEKIDEILAELKDKKEIQQDLSLVFA